MNLKKLQRVALAIALCLCSNVTTDDCQAVGVNDYEQQQAHLSQNLIQSMQDLTNNMQDLINHIQNHKNNYGNIAPYTETRQERILIFKSNDTIESKSKNILEDINLLKRNTKNSNLTLDQFMDEGIKMLLINELITVSRDTLSSKLLIMLLKSKETHLIEELKDSTASLRNYSLSPSEKGICELNSRIGYLLYNIKNASQEEIMYAANYNNLGITFLTELEEIDIGKTNNEVNTLNELAKNILNIAKILNPDYKLPNNINKYIK